MKTQLKELINEYGIEVIRKELNNFENKQSPKEWFKNLLSQMTVK